MMGLAERRRSPDGGATIRSRMLTANATPEHIRAGVAPEADGHLTKTISPASLLVAIEAALDAAAPPGESIAEQTSPD